MVALKTPLTKALADASGICFLCSGNVVRSAFAELLARHLDCPLPVESGATTYRTPGLFPETRAALRARGVPEESLDRFLPRPIDLFVKEPDERLVAFGMTRDHLRRWRAEFPGHERTFLLSELEGDVEGDLESGEIPDPVMDGAAFDATFERVEACVRTLVSKLREDVRAP